MRLVFFESMVNRRWVSNTRFQLCYGTGFVHDLVQDRDQARAPLCHFKILDDFSWHLVKRARKSHPKEVSRRSILLESRLDTCDILQRFVLQLENGLPSPQHILVLR